MCRYFCIGFIDLLKKYLTKKMNYIVICGKFRKSEKPRISYLLEKTLVLSIICSRCVQEDEKLFKEEESTVLLKILGLLENI